MVESDAPSAGRRHGRPSVHENAYEQTFRTLVDPSSARQLLRSKFSDPELAEALLATGDAELVEGNTWGDPFWGVYKGKGENMLGRLLMEVRGEIRRRARLDGRRRCGPEYGRGARRRSRRPQAFV